MTFTKIRNTLLACMLPAAMSACATPELLQENEAVRDYVAAAGLEETDRIRTRFASGTGLHPLNEYFATLSNRDGYYLVEMNRPCFALVDNTRIEPDVRRDSTSIRARFDTIRGCRIDKIYLIDEAQALELKQLGDAPGDESVEGKVAPEPEPEPE